MSFGSQALFKWKGKSCSDGEASSCCIGHSDILVMDGQCQDEFLHCSNPSLEQERINVTFRWIKQHSVSCPLRTGIQGERREGEGGGDGAFRAGARMPKKRSGCSLESCAYGRCWLCLYFPSCQQDSGHGGVLVAGHTLWVEVGGGILCVTLGEFPCLHKKCASDDRGVEAIPFFANVCAGFISSCYGEFGFCRQNFCKTSFSRFRVFSV